LVLGRGGGELVPGADVGRYAGVQFARIQMAAFMIVVDQA
jgi:hypothetical protein